LDRIEREREKQRVARQKNPATDWSNPKRRKGEATYKRRKKGDRKTRTDGEDGLWRPSFKA
jgi:hypothetical protein